MSFHQFPNTVIIILIFVKPMLIIIGAKGYKLLLNGYKLYSFLLKQGLNSFFGQAQIV